MFVLLLCTGCDDSKAAKTDEHGLVGAWRSHLQLQSGALATIRDLEFMYVFNSGGTLTESSNYDAAPPVPPAYGAWRSLGQNRYEARYEFYMTRSATPEEGIAASGGWLPAGRGVFLETITLSADGNAFTSELKYELFDQSGKPAAGAGSGTGSAERMTVQ